MPEFQFEWYHNQIFQKLDKVISGDIKKLMIFIHPRLGKSELVSKRLPAYFLGKCPQKRVLCCSNKTELATRFGRQTRSIVMDNKHRNAFDSFRLADEKREAGDWETTEGGGYLSAGVGSAIVGSGFELGIIDDPVRSREEVENPQQRDKLMEWYKSEFLSRRNPEDWRIVLMHQRWHTEDLAGMLLEEEGDEWEVINLPAINEQGEPLAVKRGFGLDFYRQAEKEMGVRAFASMYQQDPVRAGGVTFKQEDFRYFNLSDLNKEDFTVAISVDPAFSTRDGSDDVGIAVTARHKGTKEIYVLEILGEPLLPSDSYNYILSLADKWKDWTVEFISIEDAAISKDQRVFLTGFEEKMRESGKFLTLKTMNPSGKGKKEDRIKFSLEPLLNRHALYFRADDKGNEHWRKLETQFIKFPASAKDDLIDSVSQAVIMWGETQSSSGEEVTLAANTRLLRLQAKYKKD